MIILYIIAGIVVLFFSLQFFMVIKMRFKKGKDAPSLSGSAGKLIQSGNKALFYFFSPSCRACYAMTPMMEQLSRKNKNVFKIDISKDMDTARKFGVMGTPSTVVVETGKIKEFLVGAQSESRIKALL